MGRLKLARVHGLFVHFGNLSTEADRARVVERFVRLEQSRSQPGSGLGLSLASAVARLHGGELTLADNQPGLKSVIALPRGGPVQIAG
jgi:signal transduction histidine kinase